MADASSTPPAPKHTLAELRERIDDVDARILALLNERAGWALEVGELKKLDGSPVFRPEREAQVIDRLKQLNPGPLRAASVAPIWREVMSACRSLEAPTRVAYLGPAGTFSEEAAFGYFGSSIAGQPSSTIDEVFRATAAGAVDFGVVPLENSTEGVVARTLDLLLTSPVFIVGETSLPVQHNLLRRAPNAAGVQAVCAHPQALAQCHGWLSTNLPDAERRAVSSNAEGARLAAADDSLAAIASLRAGANYGLHAVAQAIQDDPNNRTRFGIVALPAAHPRPKPTGHDCTSLVVAVANQPGAVHDLLVPLKRHGVSMTRLESRPARSGQWEYVFYIDLAGHPEDAPVAAALEELRGQVSLFKLLGAYPLDTH